jgi:two-component system response regulator MprA
MHGVRRDSLSLPLKDPRAGRATAAGSPLSGDTVQMEILVVDDEQAVRESLRRALTLEGHDVSLAADGSEALKTIAASGPDLVVLDVMLPALDGLEVCRRLRAAGDRTPVLMLTARSEVEDRVTGLDAGADDYLGKPFALDELLARVRALLRRAPSSDEPLVFADVTLDPRARVVTRGPRAIELTRTEFSLLELFLRNPRRVLSRSEILVDVWGYDFGPTSNSLDVYVGYLRRKTEAGGEPRLLHTVRGVGFALREP